MLKKWTRQIALMMSIIVLFALLPATTMASDTITVTIDGQPIVFDGQGPLITEGRTLVPVRGVFEVLGFYPEWDGTTRTATLTRDDYIVVLTIGSHEFTTNGVIHTLDVPPQVIAGRTLLPLRAVLVSVGYSDMSWVSATNTVVIRTSASEQQPPMPTPTPDAEENDWLNSPGDRRVWTANSRSVVIHRTPECSSMGSPVEWTKDEALARPVGGRPCHNCWTNRGD